jgi:hypothetical protein
MKEPVLAARDAEDLEVVSARLQDAVARLGDLVYLKQQRRFAGLFNRFKWEAGEKTDLRVRSGLHFEGVLAVRSQNIKLGAPEAVVELLAIRFEPKPGEEPAGTVELVFAGGGTIHLDVECLEAELSDESGEWAARGRPMHEEG